MWAREDNACRAKTGCPTVRRKQSRLRARYTSGLDTRVTFQRRERFSHPLACSFPSTILERKERLLVVQKQSVLARTRLPCVSRLVWLYLSGRRKDLFQYCGYLSTQETNYKVAKKAEREVLRFNGMSLLSAPSFGGHAARGTSTHSPRV